KGWKWVKDTSKKIYDYGTRWVKKGWKWVKDTSKKIYDYGTRWVKKGWKTVKDTSRKVYEYGTRWVQRGWKTVKDTSRKIYKYGTRLVRKGWKKVTSWVKGIWGWVKKTKWKPKYVRERFVKSWRYATKRVPRMVKKRFVKGWHYATKRVPRMVKERFVKGWHYATKKVPNLVKERFVKGWHYAAKKVPNMVKEKFVKGWHYATKEVPRFVWKKVRVGWKEVKEKAKNSALNAEWWQDRIRNFATTKQSVLSLSASKEWEFNILEQDGFIIQSYPKNLLSMLYVNQKIDVDGKGKITVNPGSLVDYDITSGTWTVNLTDRFNVFTTLKGGGVSWGVGIKKPTKLLEADYQVDKHVLGATYRGLTHSFRSEAVTVYPDEDAENVDGKTIYTLEAKTQTIKWLGVLVAVGAVVGIGEVVAAAGALEAGGVVAGLAELFRQAVGAGAY
ncbi:MAG: hypothetical protein KGY39_08780, partial [Anaerolineales bacterium]|nr:hypothetical protein [Anaerolineales bacterium]